MIPSAWNYPEQPRLVISALGLGGHSAYFNETEPHGTKCIDTLPVFIETGSQSPPDWQN